MLKRDIKKAPFLGNCCVEKVSTLLACLENKQYTFIPYATCSEIPTEGRTGFYYLLKHKKILYILRSLIGILKTTRDILQYI